MTRQYDSVIYNHCPTDLEDDENWLGELYLPVVEVARTIALASTKREAAARAWVRTVGRERARAMRELGAPVAVLEMNSDRGQIASELTNAELWIGECLKLDNGVESWFVVATRV
jgi:hypothetical protein